MSTLAEIEEAIAALPTSQQQELYQHLGSRLAANSVPAASDKREAVEQFLRRWVGAATESVTDEKLEAQRTARLIEKHQK